MKFRLSLRPVLICAIYLVLHIASDYFARGMMIGPRLGIRQTAGLGVSLLVLGGLRYAPMVLAAHMLSSLVFNPVANEHGWIQVVIPFVITASYASMAGLVRKRLGPAPIPKNRNDAAMLVLASIAAPIPGAIAVSVLLPAILHSAPSAFWTEFLYRCLGGTGSILTIVPFVSVHVAPWLMGERKVARRKPHPRGKIEAALQVLALLAAFWVIHLIGPMRALRTFLLCAAPLAWISLSWGLQGATLATLAINLGTYFAVRLSGGAQGNLIDFLLFSISYAGVSLGLGTIVTLRNQTEEALAESQERLTQALAGARLGSWSWDITTGAVERDRIWAEMIGFPHDEVPKRVGWWEGMVHPEDWPRVKATMAEHLAGRTQFYEADFRVRTKSGAWKWFHDRGSVVARAPDGTALRIAGTQLDFTDRKMAEVEKNRLLAIIEASTDFIGIADLNFNVVYVNPALRKLLGIEGTAVPAGRRVGDIHPEWAARIIRDEAIPLVLSQGSWTGENAILGSNCQEIPVSQVMILQKDDAGKPAFIAMIARDISKQKELEAARLATERKLLEAQKLESLGVLAGGIAHDFNNLLTVMLGNASLAELILPKDSPALTNLQMIQASAIRAAELCKQMLAYSGRGQISASMSDLTGLVENTTHLLKVSVSKKCVLKFDLSRDIPSVRIDDIQIRQILLNFVTNSSEAIGDRSGVIRISTGLMRADAGYLSGTSHSPDLPEGDYVFLEVEDNGCGMTPEVIARIFDPFFTTKFAGRGLGLAAVLGIVRGHHGALRVASEAGRGTTFRLLLPAIASPSAGHSPAPVAAYPKPGASGTILVVDDEETVRTVAARVLESFGYQTVLASDGREALQIFAENPGRFRAVLLDLTMPHMNGEEAFLELRRVRADVQVILMSGFSEEDSIDRFAGNQPAGFVPKPFDRDTLIRKLRAVLEGPA